jgi:8-oxo-dGTP pyrophosphatase MutT (NUDIX family)
MTQASSLFGREHAAMDPEAAEVKASGGVVWRRGDRGLEVALVHRPRYDDWSFPKGKLDGGESWEQAALREVEEEVGLKCRLGHELPPTAYRDNKGRSKVVRYWMMEPLEGEFVPSHEVDEVRWMPADRAADMLTYPHDRELLREVTG